MKFLLLSLVLATPVFASHECKNYAIEKAAKYVELLVCDSYVQNCKVSKNQIKVMEFVELQSSPSVDVYTLDVPVSAQGAETMNAPVNVVVSLLEAGSDKCTTLELSMAEEDQGQF